jgi:hypothetical protein
LNLRVAAKEKKWQNTMKDGLSVNGKKRIQKIRNERKQSRKK